MAACTMRRVSEILRTRSAVCTRCNEMVWAPVVLGLEHAAEALVWALLAEALVWALLVLAAPGVEKELEVQVSVSAVQASVLVVSVAD